MKNNKGFTLLELIVVIAIIVAMTGIIGISLNYASSTNAKGCASDTLALISKCKVSSLSRAADVFVIFEKGADGDIIGKYYENTDENIESLESKTLAGSGVIFSYMINGKIEMLENQPLILAFDRKTGGFMDIKSATKLIGAKDALGITTSPDSNDAYCTQINIASGGRTYTIKLGVSTGSHKLGNN